MINNATSHEVGNKQAYGSLKLSSNEDTNLRIQNVPSTNTNEQESQFVRLNNDRINEIVLNMADFINQLASLSKDDFQDETKFNNHYEIYLSFSELIANFSEKSPFKPSQDGLNKLVNYVIQSSIYILKISSNNKKSSVMSKRLLLEIYRALGSLLYQNGPNLNESNLSNLFGKNETYSIEINDNNKLDFTNGLLYFIRDSIEFSYKSLTKINNREDEELLDLTNKTNLILTQLVYNLTLPTSLTLSSKHDSTSSPNVYSYLSDKHKVKCVYLIIRILRYHSTSNDQIQLANTSSTFIDSLNKQFSNNINSGSSFTQNDEYQSNMSRILTKALQSLENLIFSIQLANNGQLASKENHGKNWLLSNSNQFQLGDILAIIKSLSFYGITLKSNSTKKSIEITNPVFEQKTLEPSDVHALLPEIDKTSKNDLLEDNANNDDVFNEETSKTKDSFNENEFSNIRRNSKSGYNSKRAFSTNSISNNSMGKSYEKKRSSYSKASLSYRNPSQSDINPSTDLILNKTNSGQCFKETQVPLIQYKTLNNEIKNSHASDSETSTDSSSSTFYKEKSNAKVRITAIASLLTAFQSLDKRIVLGYWDSFLGGSSSNYNLVWSVCNDHSPKVRLIASNCLSVYLECVRAFFTIAAAEESIQTSSIFQSSTTSIQQSTSAFLPISFTIASLIRQMHKDLLNALCYRETFNLNIVNLLKCLQTLVKSTPYQKLRPGLIYKIITSLNQLLNHKSAQFFSSNGHKESLILLLIEVLNTLKLILNNHCEMAEVHLAFLSPILDTNLNNSHKQDNDKNESDVSTKLEQLTTNLKVPVISQSRVTYFYELNNCHSFKSSLNNSNPTSGQITPSLMQINDLVTNETIDTSKKPWIVDFCINYSKLDLNNRQENYFQFSCQCIDMLINISRKSFDLIRKETCFEPLCQLILENIEYAATSRSLNNELIDQVKLKTLKLLEDFARCLATNELRLMSGIDLNDCCKFWSSLLNSKLISELLCDEQRYLLSSCACDCLSSIGGSIFELLPFQKRIYCLTNLLHLTKSQSSLIRSSSVRGLGVYVTFASLKEDQTFLNDLSLCLLNSLANDQNNLVRQKTAWSISNLSEVLVENGDKLNKVFTDEYNLTVWQRLLDTTSNACFKESDKFKSYLVRALGNLIHYITLVDLELIKSQLGNTNNVERSLSRAIEALCSCKSVKMLKVKWNLSHAIGVAMRQFNNWPLQSNNPKWLKSFYDTLIELLTESTNFKVRINACSALMTINLNEKSSVRSIDKYCSKDNKLSENIYIKLWISLIENFAKLENSDLTNDLASKTVNDDSNEMQHKNTLTHQLCKFLTYLCKYLRIDDLESLMKSCLNDLKSHSNNSSIKLKVNQLRRYLISYIRNIFNHIDLNKIEVQYHNEALTQLNLLNSVKKTSLDEDCILLLNSILKKPALKNNTNSNCESEQDYSSKDKDFDENDTANELDSSAMESKPAYRKKFPFMQTYD